MSSKKNILHIIDSAGYGGGERYVIDIIKNSDQSFNHSVVIPYGGPFEGVLKKNNCKYTIISMNYKNIINSIRLLNKFILAHNVDIIHSHGFRANFYARIARVLTSKKHVSTIHVSLYDYIDTSYLIRLFYIFIEKLFSVYTDRFVCISRAMKQDTLKMGIAPQRIVLIPNGVDTNRFYPREPDYNLKKELGIPPDTTLIGTVGRMVSEKGQIYLIESLKYLKYDLPKLKCLFIGEGPLRAQLKKKAESDTVIDMCLFLEPLRDIENIYPLLSIFVLPSLREPFGLVLLEAMASGIPVIATSAGGPLDFIKHDINGILVPPGDAIKLAESIKELLLNSDKRNSLKNEGLKTVNRYKIEKMVKSIEKLYMEILSES